MEPGVTSGSADEDAERPTAQAIEELLSRIAASVVLATDPETSKAPPEPEGGAEEGPGLLGDRGPGEPAL
ncbi:MAG: hypothetical protein ACYDAD_00525 [Acidimicrobiales bacterium]